METYKAVTAAGFSIITVGADSVEQAHRNITQQLQRPGREGGFEQWKAHGFQIRCPDNSIQTVPQAREVEDAVNAIRNALWSVASDLEQSKRKVDQRTALVLLTVGNLIEDYRDLSTYAECDVLRSRLERLAEQVREL